MFRLLLGLFGVLATTSCAELTLAWADLNDAGPEAAPALDTSAKDFNQTWREESASVLAAFEARIYGKFPDASSSNLVRRTTIDSTAFGGKGVLEEYEIAASAKFGNIEIAAAPFRVNLLLPANASSPSTVIMMETFCPRHETLPHKGVTRLQSATSCDLGLLSGVMKFVFGRYIATPPIEEILERGYAIAAIYPGEAIPDSRSEGLEALEALAVGHDDADTRWGAVAGWAWIYSRTIDILETDERLGAIIAWGHSRYAKAALLAAASDARIAGVIAHQSGTAGASLNRDKKGETIASITRNYPHWFARAYSAYAGREEELPVDQHLLLALIAPRPILLGNARRDVWSDPNGAFRAAKGASPAYRALGASGLTTNRLDDYDPRASLSFWMRAGTHGITKKDWSAFLDFLDAHFSSTKQ